MTPRADRVAVITATGAIMSEQNIATLRRLMEIVERGDLDALHETPCTRRSTRTSSITMPRATSLQAATG